MEALFCVTCLLNNRCVKTPQMQHIILCRVGMLVGSCFVNVCVIVIMTMKLLDDVVGLAGQVGSCGRCTDIGFMK